MISDRGQFNRSYSNTKVKTPQDKIKRGFPGRESGGGGVLSSILSQGYLINFFNRVINCHVSDITL